MSRTREKAKGRKTRGAFAGIPKDVMDHPDYVDLSANARSLLFELAYQYNGRNNGNLTAAWTVMSKRGWKSKTTLAKALKELLINEFALLTRTGIGLNPGKRCALYAVTWQPIDECIGKDLEVNPTTRPPRSFTAKIINLPSPETVPSRYRICTYESENEVV